MDVASDTVAFDNPWLLLPFAKLRAKEEDSTGSEIEVLRAGVDKAGIFVFEAHFFSSSAFRFASVVAALAFLDASFSFSRFFWSKGLISKPKLCS